MADLIKIPKTAQSLLDVQQQPFVLVDKNYRIVAANRAYCKQHHIEPDVIIGKTCHRVSHKSSRPCHEQGEDCPHQRMFASGKVEEAIHVHNHSDGATEYVEIRAFPIRGEDGQIEFMGEQMTPIEPRKILAEESMVGDSPIFLAAVNDANLLASVHLPILLCGESGSGKEGFAHYIHKQASQGIMPPFITVDCYCLDDVTFDVTLFGQEASSAEDGIEIIGLIEKAHRGTLLLDEIGDLSPAMQSKLLRVIETGQYRRVGGDTTLHSEMRIISTTNKNLHGKIEAEQFRADLFFRIAGHTLEIPPLRRRKPDIIQLSCYFLNQLGKNTAPSKQTLEILERYPYPGNVRELKSIIEIAALKSADASALQPEHLPEHIKNWEVNTSERSPTIRRFFEENQKVTPGQEKQINRTGTRNFDRYALGVDREQVLAILNEFSGSRRKTAMHLGITERKLYRLLKRYRETGVLIPDKVTKLAVSQERKKSTKK